MATDGTSPDMLSADPPTPTDLVSQAAHQVSVSDVSRTEATPIDTEMSDPPTEPQVSTEPCLRSRVLHRAKRQRHPSTKTDSVTPSAKYRPLSPDLDHALADLTLSNTVINSFSCFSPSIPIPIDATAQSPSLLNTQTFSRNAVTFRDPLINDTLSVCLQPELPEDSFRPWAMVEDAEIDTSLPATHDFGPANHIAWTLIQDYLILAEKYRGRSTLTHNARVSDRLPDWSLGITKIPALMIPPSQRQDFFSLIRRQAVDRLAHLEEALTNEANLCDKVAAVHTETMTRMLDNEQDKVLFPGLRNRTTKLARSRAATYGKRVFDSVGKRPASNEELDDALIESLPQHEFKVVSRKQARSRSPLPGPSRSGHSRPRSRSPKPRPSTSKQAQPRAPKSSTNKPNARSNQPTSYANAAQRRPQSNPRPARPQNQNFRRNPTQAAPSANLQLSAEELAGLRALLNNNNNHGGRQ